VRTLGLHSLNRPSRTLARTELLPIDAVRLSVISQIPFLIPSVLSTSFPPPPPPPPPQNWSRPLLTSILEQTLYLSSKFFSFPAYEPPATSCPALGNLADPLLTASGFLEAPNSLVPFRATFKLFRAILPLAPFFTPFYPWDFSVLRLRFVCVCSAAAHSPTLRPRDTSRVRTH